MKKKLRTEVWHFAITDIIGVNTFSVLITLDHCSFALITKFLLHRPLNHHLLRSIFNSSIIHDIVAFFHPTNNVTNNSSAQIIACSFSTTSSTCTKSEHIHKYYLLTKVKSNKIGSEMKFQNLWNNNSQELAESRIPLNVFYAQFYEN